jgi:soluble cytochrome b562
VSKRKEEFNVSDDYFEPVVLEFAVDHTQCMEDTARLSDKLEELRGLLYEVVRAIEDKGKNPTYHQQTMKRHRTEWPVLWKALDKIRKEMKK